MSAIVVMHVMQNMPPSLLLFVQLTRIVPTPPSGQVVEPQSVVVPLLFDINQNTLKVAERSVTGILTGIQHTLRRFYEYNQVPPSKLIVHKVLNCPKNIE